MFPTNRHFTIFVVCFLLCQPLIAQQPDLFCLVDGELIGVESDCQCSLLRLEWLWQEVDAASCDPVTPTPECEGWFIEIEDAEVFMSASCPLVSGIGLDGLDDLIDFGVGFNAQLAGSFDLTLDLGCSEGAGPLLDSLTTVAPALGILAQLSAAGADSVVTFAPAAESGPSYFVQSTGDADARFAWSVDSAFGTQSLTRDGIQVDTAPRGIVGSASTESLVLGGGSARCFIREFSIDAPRTHEAVQIFLAADGIGDFGDEDFDAYPIDVSFRLATLPEGPRQLAQVGPLELRYEFGAIEARLALADGGESFISRPMVPADLVAVRVAENFWSLTVGTGATGKAVTPPAPDPGVFTLGAEPGAEVRLLDFTASSGRIFSDGFESGDLSRWSPADPLG